MKGSFKGYPIVSDKASHTHTQKKNQQVHYFKRTNSNWNIWIQWKELKFPKGHIQYPSKTASKKQPTCYPVCLPNFLVYLDPSTWQSLGALLQDTRAKFAVQASNHVGHIIGGTLGKDSAAYSYQGRKKNRGSARSTMVKDSTGR